MNSFFGLESRIDRIVDNYIHGLSPGCTFLAARSGKPLFCKSYGYADLAEGRPIQPDDHFVIASNTKQFTCFAILLLRDMGMLDIDEPVAKFFPEMPKYTEKITPRMLMSHTSGIPDYYDKEYEHNRDALRTADAAGVLEIARGWGDELLFEPDTAYSYSNTGYVMLGEIIKQLSGMTFGEFMEQRIFKMIGLRNSKAPDRPEQKDPLLVQGYASVTDANKADPGERITTDAGTFRAVPFDRMEFGYADGCISTNVHDLMIWHRFLHGLSPGWSRDSLGDCFSTSEQVFPHKLKNGEKIPYGMGIMTGSFDDEHRALPGHTELWHTGSVEGFISRVSYFADCGVSGIMLTNWNGIDRDGLFGDVMKKVFNSLR